ncbi:MAG: methyltransferase domain-containing protein, partial [Candidatus Riflebacteria bacterium]
MHLKRDRAEAFNRIAENYERFRPGYPEALREKIEELAGLKAGAELLEVGVGPGQATRLFINRGYKIVGNEPGEQLRNTAWKSLEMPGGLTLEGGNFEDWCPAGRFFDLLYSGSAFHWVDPEKGFPKAAEVLKSSGCIALFWNMFPETTDPIWKEIEGTYAQYAPEIAEKRYKRDFNSTIEKRRCQ